MRRALALALASVIALGCETQQPAVTSASAAAASAGGVPVARALTAKLRDDLRYFSEQMPKVHLNLFHSTSRTAWRAAIADLEAKLDRLTPAQFEVELLRLVALTHDAHTQLQSPYAGTTLVPAFHEFPVVLYAYSDGMFVQQAAPAYARLAGARVIAIDGVPVADAAMRVTPLIDRDSDAMLGWYTARYLVVAEFDEAVGITRSLDRARFTVEIAGKTEDVDLGAQPITAHGGWIDARAAAAAPTPLYLRDPGNAYWATRIADAMYVQWNAVLNKTGSEESIFGFFTRVMQDIDARPVSKLIIDVRFNQGGERSNVDPVVQMIASRPAVDRAGTLFVITGRRAFSSGVVFCAQMERRTNVTFVGEPASSRPNQYATIARITLPNTGLVIGASTQWNEDAAPSDERPWISPQMAVALSSSQYAHNIDPALDAVLAIRR